MTIIRGGTPRPIRGTVPAQPGAAIPDKTALAPFHFWVDCAAVWIRIQNTGANPLRVFFREGEVMAIAPTSYRVFIEIPVSGGPDPSFIEGLYEVKDLFLMGLGGSTTFQALMGQRHV